MSYQEYTITCASGFIEILIAEFSQLGFDTFQENELGFITYLEGEMDDSLLEGISNRYAKSAQFTYGIKKIIKQNWNKEWEKNYDPIVIDESCIVKAPFHTDLPAYPVELIITPKMSFGTGHHETTHLMLAEILTLDLKAKSVMDAGTGTGVLAILAKKQGASSVFAYDIDEWCVENTTENAEVNGVEIEVLKASIEDLDLSNGYDIVLANINKNILLSQMSYYKKALNKGGSLLLSGFYEADLEDIKRSATENGLVIQHHIVRNNWTLARFSKET
ncbi:MAG: 50S ribosomal protein L11 methyltransferase [Cyclobacteriaceae bacterium]|nr:50S ribosomal protein L11 methyltransferase [Cyclobacteriaceae bacterium]